MRTSIMFLVSILVLGLTALGHGEDRPGPNGGYIRMPGGFHTEVILLAPNSLKIYLLDMDWKKPSVLNSKLSIVHKLKKTMPGKCSVEDDHYLCTFPKSINLEKKGELIVDAQRENQKGNVVKYELPLALKKKESSHEGHH